MPCHCLVVNVLTVYTAACQDVNDLLLLPLVQAYRTFLRLS